MLDGQRIPKLCKTLLDRGRADGEILSLAEFKQLYHCVTSSVDTVPLVHIVLLGRSAIVQFTDIANAPIAVRHGRRLTPEDFSDTVSRAIVLGDKRRHSLLLQLKEEKGNAPVLAVVFFLVLFAVFWIGYQPAIHYGDYLVNPQSYPDVGLALDGLSKVAELLVTSATLFISIFLVFTVAQNVGMLRDDFLFNEGLAHKYYRDDRFVSAVALASLAAGILSIVILVLPSRLEVVTKTIGNTTMHINKFSLFLPITLSLCADGLTLCFLSIVYYFERVVANIGVIMAQRSLSDARKRFVARLPESARATRKVTAKKRRRQS